MSKKITPCILPWINFGTNPYGRARPCGYSDQALVGKNKKIKDSSIGDEWNNDYFKEIRLSFLNGDWPENCKRCEYVESLNGHSKRLDENAHWNPLYENLIQETLSDGSVPYSPQHIDIRTGTVCNLKCIHCGTGASSKWKEDKLLLDKYSNTVNYDISNKWIDSDTRFWDELRTRIHEIKRYNFLGGESFANKRHNEFLKELSESEYAKNVRLAYVSNGTLINEERLDQLSKFKRVDIRLSVDALEKAGEYFRFPIKWETFTKQLKVIDEYISGNPVFDFSVQWTCSNISMFYLVETYDIIRTQFPNIRFLFCNHVESPEHMSAQNLPQALKDIIVEKINNYAFKEADLTAHEFYVKHMLEKDMWTEQGTVLMNYLDDLDAARNISWKEHFKEMELWKYDPR